MVYAGLITAVLGLALKFTLGWRIEPESEFEGIDIHEHRETAYDEAGGEQRAVTARVGSVQNQTRPVQAEQPAEMRSNR
jgi:Amt family ammonium transporter